MSALIADGYLWGGDLGQAVRHFAVVGGHPSSHPGMQIETGTRENHHDPTRPSGTLDRHAHMHHGTAEIVMLMPTPVRC